jgi:hypothetical protein
MNLLLNILFTSKSSELITYRKIDKAGAIDELMPVFISVNIVSDIRLSYFVQSLIAGVGESQGTSSFQELLNSNFPYQGT